MTEFNNTEVLFNEWNNSRTSPTRNQFFDDNGYLIFKGILNSQR